METMTTKCEARALSIVRSGKKVPYDERSRARRKNRAEQSDLREQGSIQDQRGCPTYQHSPKRLVNHSRLCLLVALIPWRALLFQAAVPLDGTRLLPNLRTLYNPLTLRCHTCNLLSNWINRTSARMGTPKVLGT